MPVHAIVTSIAQIPLAASLAHSLVPVPAVAQEWPIVLVFYDHFEAAESALAAFPKLDIYDNSVAFSGLSLPESHELRSLVPVVVHLFYEASEHFLTTLTYPFVCGIAVAAPEADVLAALAAAKLSASRVKDLPEAKKLAKIVEKGAEAYAGTFLLGDPEALAAATPEALEKAVPLLGLRTSPSLISRWKTLVASHPRSLSVAVWRALLTYDDDRTFARALDAEHVRIAATAPEVRLSALLTVAQKGDVAQTAEKPAKKGSKSPGTPSLCEVALVAWAAQVSAKTFLDAVSEALERCDKGAVDPGAFWSILAAYLVANPSNPLEVPPFDVRASITEEHHRGAHSMAIYVAARFPKPKGPAKEALVAWCAAYPGGFGAYTKTFAAKVGDAVKLVLPSYPASDLEGLAAPLAKAWKSARDKSGKQGITLPNGLDAPTIEALIAGLPGPIPDDVRSFYRLHDGAGDDECFRSCRLFRLAEAVETRKTLLSYTEGHRFPAEWLPLTADGAGNHACVVLAGKNIGQIVDFDHETGAGTVLAKSFATYVEKATWG